MSKRHGATIQRQSDGGFGETIIYTLPMSKEARKALDAVHPNLNAIQCSDPARRSRLQMRAKLIETRTRERRQSQDMPDRWHVLVDEMGKKLKQAAMTYEEAQRRNCTIADLGLKWTPGTK
jgi:hypothetical protein